MANTPHYDLPLFETNDIPSWLRDWNSAMTKIDAGINSVAQEMSGFQTDVDNAVNTANSAAGQVTQLSGQVTSLNNRVTALEEGGGGGGTPPVIPPIPNGILNSTDGNLWQPVGSLNNITQSQAAVTIEFGDSEDNPSNWVLGEEIITQQGTQGGLNLIGNGTSGRLNTLVTDYNGGSFPVTVRLLTGSRRVNGGRWILTNSYTIMYNVQPPSTGHTASGSDFRVTISSGLNAPNNLLQLQMYRLWVTINSTLQYPNN